MKNYIFLIFSILLINLTSCDDDLGTVEATYFEATAVYGDLNDIRNQPLNESSRPIADPGKIYIGEDFILIGEEEKGIHVINNVDPENPINVSFINIPGNREYFVNGNSLFAESYYDIIKLDISDPFHVVLMSRAENVFNTEFKNDQGETLLGFTFNEVRKVVDQDSDLFNEINNNSLVYYDFAQNIIPKSAVPASFAGNSNNTSGTVNRITYHNEHLYIAGRNDINIIKDDDSFTLVKTLEDAGQDMETIFPNGNNLFIGSRSSMEIFDASNPESPVHLFRFEHATSCDPVLPIGDVVYISLRTADFSDCPGNVNAVIVLDIENLSSPVEINEIEMYSPFGMALIGDVLYVGEGLNGITAFDASNPKELVHIFHDASITAYDILEHPTRSDLILVAGPSGLDQYKIEDSVLTSLQSRINF